MKSNEYEPGLMTLQLTAGHENTHANTHAHTSTHTHCEASVCVGLALLITH